ncbi:unnamed protein product [Brassicogethes aeneus]|uniref:UDP-glucuronosyltransferase n=1 Tax=Brassicogethes aeneus TaxID=1431903 RepID=A0A9P0BEM4_BRAAE|nr:unnamed protein product [Brassicogethes aeneus]
MFHLKCLVMISLLNIVSCYNILGVFLHPGKSHVDVFLPLMKELADRGHYVTVLSHYKLKVPIDRYTDIDLVGEVTPMKEVVDMQEIADNKFSSFREAILLGEMANISCETSLKMPGVQDLIRKKKQHNFDIIVSEFFNSDCHIGFHLLFQAPLIGITSSTLMPWTSKRVANPSNPSYIPNNLMRYSDVMTFGDRVLNTIAYIWHQFYFDVFINANDQRLINSYFNRRMPSIKEGIYNVSLVLTNTHFSLNLPRPLVPNVVEIGGIHIGKAKKVPKNIEKWIDGSSDGVIYFSLGSMIKGHTFPTDKRKEFLKAFGKLSQTVLWKWENETMEGKPDNVMIQKWMPQFDILCHPNVKAFISHGGLLGVTEAVHCGVPVIVMPQFGDQFTNAKALESVGGGVILHLSEATEESISKALKKVLSSKFRQQAKELSERFRDRPMSPMDTAIYWVEYVARHKGAPHMRTAAVNMPFYQYYLLDVISFLILIVSLTLYIVVYVLKTMLKLFLSSSRKVKIN